MSLNIQKAIGVSQHVELRNVIKSVKGLTMVVNANLDYTPLGFYSCNRALFYKLCLFTLISYHR